jgi:hypothetical protein
VHVGGQGDIPRRKVALEHRPGVPGREEPHPKASS